MANHIYNGDFASGQTGWAYGGTATFTGEIFTSTGESGYRGLVQTDADMISSFAPNTEYILSFDLGISSGSIWVSIYNSATAVAYSATEVQHSTAGTKTVTFTTPADVGVGGITIRMDVYANFTLDNISLDVTTPAGAISGTSNGISTIAAALTGSGRLNGISSGISTNSGNLTEAASDSGISGISTGGSSNTGILTAKGILSGTSDGIATNSGSISGNGILSSTVTGQTTLSGTISGTGSLYSSINSLSLVGGTLGGRGDLQGAILTGSSLTGTLISNFISGVSTGSSSVSGLITGSSDIIPVVSTTQYGHGPKYPPMEIWADMGRRMVPVNPVHVPANAPVPAGSNRGGGSHTVRRIRGD